MTGARIYHRDYGTQDLVAMHSCAMQFAPLVPASGRIVVRGGTMFDEYGHPVAHNQSMVFAWMDRKGFNYGDEELSLDTLVSIAARGGRYWMAGDDELERDSLKSRVDTRYRRIATCAEGYALYDLFTRPNFP